MLKFLVKDLIDEFILCGDDGYDIISIFVLFALDDFIPLLDIEISCDFREKHTEREDDDTPCGIDDIPDGGNLFFDFDEFCSDLIGDALEGGIWCE